MNRESGGVICGPLGDQPGPSPVAGAVAHIGHVELLTPDVQASRDCFVDVLGLREIGRRGESVYLRGESEYERVGLILTASERPGIAHVGLRTRNAAALAERVAALRGAGISGTWTEGDLGHGPAFAFTAAAGHLVELYWETERYVPPSDDRPRDRDRLGLRGGRGVDVRRLDHVNLLAADVAGAALESWNQLGFALRDQIRDDDGSVTGAWMALGPRPLELIYTRDPRGAAGRLHHVAFWVDTREEVLRAADILLDQGVAIEVPPAQHTIGRSFFLYGFEPGGNRIEVTTGADLVLDPDPPTRSWTAAERRAGVGWGTVFPPTWSEYATPDLPV